ncbi:uncharacterized protein AB675_268 [Cyphellophora attinorum]|uniref:C2H2-type domain-containing protein n=1 Tax=Cyphellophora attinorum TaxID=1664694 RepID=A0A0N0NSA5_9EURO|nr:uncharacterized protein AB675_268 [Phialophora attinorum]KPI45779.1 hypothetical protein AB675_268 [Phialophora attinorum]
MNPLEGIPPSPPRDSLKRPRSESSDDDADPEPISYNNPPGVRYGKDSLVCDQCGVGFRKHSDLKKHNARHARQYRCIEVNCPRTSIGFATINDLYRHEKSVHGKHVGKSRMYKCFAPGCAKASKLWPRLDNFKQHLIRMHPNEDIDALVKRSEQWQEEEEGGPDSMQLDRIDTQDSVISSLQNVKRLRSPPHLPGPSGDRMLTHRWDVTPPTSATNPQGRPDQLLRGIVDKPQTNGTPASGRQPGDPYRQIQPTGPDGNRMGGPNATPTHPSHSQRDSQMSEPPPLEPDESKTISRAAEVRELSSEARCGSCHLAGRRCYIDSANPRHCVSCPTENHCIFRRTVVREGPATHFLWHELVGIHNIPQAMPLHHQQQHMIHMQQPPPGPGPHPMAQGPPPQQPSPIMHPRGPPQPQGQPGLDPALMTPAPATAPSQPPSQPAQLPPSQQQTPAQQQLQGPQSVASTPQGPAQASATLPADPSPAPSLQQ